ncbi:MAG TPA: L-2-hydroxyglutarate oxidase [Spirochaetota bacterium]|nr:L-2-hydroxyglutarate oxidase [Spirochaetota bacterium]HPI89802.1 L-2-hydroxyglutarate oxidase [Spirochaetota bacterium]HPR47557.1 L-2-hydroxyglutarate oxidase [Spirochaetota bacterium]
MKKFETVICGAGIVGLTIARELIQRGCRSLAVIEKEGKPGMHASGRNSGVLHAGIYYSTDSLKAKFCAEGNRGMKAYCKKKGLPLVENGKVIVAKNEAEVEVVHELHRRAVANGAQARLIDEKGLNAIEPMARTCGTGLHSPDTAVVDPKSVLKSLVEDLDATGRVTFLFDTRVDGLDSADSIRTENGTVAFDLFVNAAGAYSDIIAHSAGLAPDLKLIPFKGTYRKIIPSKSGMVKGNIYPVPNIKNPFLGVHFTKNTAGDLYLGPTAIPAFGRENYGIVSGIDRESATILYRDAMLFLANPKFRNIAIEEPKKYLSRYFYNSAKELVKHLDFSDIEQSDKVGIRPQLVDWKKKELVMDFMVIRHEKSIHILNAISPAFTCSMPFAKYVADNYL